MLCSCGQVAWNLSKLTYWRVQSRHESANPTYIHGGGNCYFIKLCNLTHFAGDVIVHLFLMLLKVDFITSKKMYVSLHMHVCGSWSWTKAKNFIYQIVGWLRIPDTISEKNQSTSVNWSTYNVPKVMWVSTGTPVSSYRTGWLCISQLNSSARLDKSCHSCALQKFILALISNVA